MAGAFKRAGGRVRVRLSPQEAAVLRNLPDQLRGVLTAEQLPGGQPDPVTARLFPPAYRDAGDREREEEYHTLVHDDLLNARLANLDLMAGSLARGSVSMRRWTVDLSEEEAMAWLGVLNDLRLALGVRLGIEEDFDGRVDESDPSAPAMNLLAYLGWLEELLVETLSA